MTDMNHAKDHLGLNDDVRSATASSTAAHVLQCRARTRILLTVALGLLLAAGWKVYHDREFWSLLLAGPHWGSCDPAGLTQIGRSPESSFDLRSLSIPREEIHAGGPPKDGIPALMSPKFIPAKRATFLGAGDRIVGVARDREAKAYPLRILNYHEVVNDRLGKTPIAVTYCPLCDSVAVFDRRTPLGVREFGVSGLLYNSNVLMYDRKGKPESLWSQVAASGVSGPGRDKPLDLLPFEVTTWTDWQARFPHTTVLDANTGHRRDYRISPYDLYFESTDLMFPAQPTSDRLPIKEPVIGVLVGDLARAYPMTELARLKAPLEQSLGGGRFSIAYDAAAKSARIVKANNDVRWIYSFWFAWYAFRPHTEVFPPTEQDQSRARPGRP